MSSKVQMNRGNRGENSPSGDNVRRLHHPSDVSSRESSTGNWNIRRTPKGKRETLSDEKPCKRRLSPKTQHFMLWDPSNRRSLCGGEEIGAKA